MAELADLRLGDWPAGAKLRNSSVRRELGNEHGHRDGIKLNSQVEHTYRGRSFSQLEGGVGTAVRLLRRPESPAAMNRITSDLFASLSLIS